MAQIGQTFPSLEHFFGDKAGGALLATEQFNQAMRSGEINQEQALQDMFQSGEKHPLEMQAKRDVHDRAAAELPGQGALSDMHVQDASDQKALGPTIRQDALKGKAQEQIAKGGAAKFAQEAINLYASGTPENMKKANIMFHALERHEELKQDATQKRKLAEIKATGVEARLNIGAYKDAGRYDSKARTKDPYVEMLSKGNLAGAYQYQADQETNPEKKAAWQQAADASTRDRKEKERYLVELAAAKAGNLNIPAIADMDATTIPPLPPAGPRPTLPPKGVPGPGTMKPGGPVVQPAGARMEPRDAAPISGSPPINKLKEGSPTTFKNGQVWQLKDGKPVRIK